MGLKLCVFPNDPIEAYYKKGEIKERYFNPLNLFQEVHVLSLTDAEVNEDKVKIMAGDADFKIHVLGKINLANYSRAKNKVLKLVEMIRPNVIRAYNPLVAGWLATYCSMKLKIPLVVSLHIQLDNFRTFTKSHNRLQYAKLLYTEKFIEPYVLKNARTVVCVYKVIVPYAKRMGAKDIRIIYNRVNLSRFGSNKEKAFHLDKPVIMSVGRLTPQKNHECIIRSIQGLNVYLVIIGDGEKYAELVNLTKELNLENNIKFIKAVPNSEIHKYYASANIFALAMRTELESLPIPVLEAMASGLPIVIPKPVYPEFADDIYDVVMPVDPTPEAFRDAFQKLLTDSSLAQVMGQRARQKAKEFDGLVMEEKEMRLYQELIG